MIFPSCHLTLIRSTLYLDRYPDSLSASRIQDPVKTAANGEYSGYTVGTALLHFSKPYACSAFAKTLQAHALRVSHLSQRVQDTSSPSRAKKAEQRLLQAVAASLSSTTDDEKVVSAL